MFSILGFNRYNGRYSQKVTKLETANFSHPFYGTLLVTRFMEHHVLIHSLHFNDYKSDENKIKFFLK